MRKLILGIILTLAGIQKVQALDTVCLGGGCPGVDTVQLANSTPSFFMIITTNGIQFGDGTTQTTAGGAGGGGTGQFFTFTDNGANKVAITSMTFPASLFTRLVSGSSQTILVNPSSFTLMGANPADPRFSLFLTTGQAQIAAAGGFTLFKSTAEQKINDAGGFTLFIATFVPAAGGGGSGGTTSSTMVVIQGGTDGQPQNIVSFQNSASTIGYATSSGYFNWESSMNVRGVVTSTSGFAGPGTNLTWVGKRIVLPSAVSLNRPVVYTNTTSGANTLGNLNGTAMDMGSLSILGSSSIFLNANTAAFYAQYGNFGNAPTPTRTKDLALSVSSAAGAAGPMMIISTGSTKLFEVTGTSINARAVPFFIGHTSCDTLDTNANGEIICGSDAQGAGSDPIAVASGSIAHLTSTRTASFQTVEATSYHLIGGGAGQLNSTSGEIQIGVNGAVDMRVNNSSVTIIGDLIFNNTFYAAINYPTFVSIATSTYEIDFPTMVSRGRAQFDANHSSSVYAICELQLPPLIVGSTPTIKSMRAVSRAASDAGDMIFGLSIATVSGGGFDPQNLVFRSTVVVNLSGTAGAVQSIKETTTEKALSGWNQYTGGGNIAVYIRVTPMGGSSTAKRYFHDAILKWAQQN